MNRFVVFVMVAVCLGCEAKVEDCNSFAGFSFGGKTPLQGKVVSVGGLGAGYRMPAPRPIEGLDSYIVMSNIEQKVLAVRASKSLSGLPTVSGEREIKRLIDSFAAGTKSSQLRNVDTNQWILFLFDQMDEKAKPGMAIIFKLTRGNEIVLWVFDVASGGGGLGILPMLMCNERIKTN